MKSDENLEISVISTTDETAVKLSICTEPKRNPVTRCLCNCYHSLLLSRKECSLVAAKILIFLLFYGSAFGILNTNALPGSEIFALLLLAILSFVGGKIFCFLRIPPLVGMLLVGFLFRNLPFVPFYHDISPKTAPTLRDIALVIILLSAGLGLDGKKLHTMKMVVLQLICFPLIAEVGSMAVFSHYFLNLPWLWGIMLGFVTAAISVAVILPMLMKLKGKNLGSDKGIPTLILAASSFDDIVAITGFTVVMSIIFSEGNLTLILIKAPLEPLVGCAIGAVIGVIFWHLPSKDISKPFLVYYHMLFLIFGGLSMMFVTDTIGMAGSGSLGCITLAFVASLRWRKDPEQFESIERVTAILWSIVEPFLFALVGAEVSLENLSSNIGYSILVVILSVGCRMLVTPFVTFGANLNLKEKIFVSVAWLPKATVQAAIGSRALDYARMEDRGDQFIMYGQEILTVSVLSVIITAPLGAALTSVLAPYLLTEDEASSDTASDNPEETGMADKTTSPMNYGSCHQLQPSDILAPKAE